MAPPVTVDDTVVYTPRNLYLDKTVTVTLLDGSQLNLWGPVFVDGNPLALLGALPIATNAEALAGTDNTKVMTPLRVREAGDARYALIGGGGGVTDGDKGEITIASGIWTIDNGVITVAKLASDVTAKFVDITGDILTGTLNFDGTVPAIRLRNGTGATVYGSITGASNAIAFASGSSLVDILFSIGGVTKVDIGDTVVISVIPITVPDDPYAVGWNGSTQVPTKNAVYDKIESLSGGGVTSVNTKVGVVTLNQDEILDGTTFKQYSQTEKTKLAGIATGATVNSSDATLLNRANHTGTQSADTIVDGTTNKTFSAAEDTKLAGIATGATANATDAQLRDRSTHTGTQSADTLTDGTTNKAFLATERTKLTGIATGATANSPDATLLARANHTGTQAESTVTNLVTDLAAKAVDTAVVHNTGTETIAGSKTFSGYPMVPDEVYNSSWNNSMEVPTKNALWDKIETISAGGGASVVGGADKLYLLRTVY